MIAYGILVLLGLAGLAGFAKDMQASSSGGLLTVHFSFGLVGVCAACSVRRAACSLGRAACSSGRAACHKLIVH